MAASGIVRAAQPNDSNIHFVRLPAGIAEDDLLAPSPEVRGALDEAVSRALSPAADRDSALDAIIVFVDARGRAIVPVRHDAATSASARTPNTAADNELTFVIDPSSGWTPAETATLQQLLADCYPAEKTIYGPPLFNLAINVRKGPADGFAGEYEVSTHTMTMSSIFDVTVPCHEMAHAFHRALVIGRSTYEEGFARAVEILTFNQLPQYTTEEVRHQYTYDIFHEALNRPAVSCGQGSVFCGRALTVLRYYLSGYAWSKAYLEDSTFFARFNSSYAAAAKADSSVQYSLETLEALAASTKPVVEGDPVALWVRRQYVLRDEQLTGYRLYQRVNQTMIDYSRRQFGAELEENGAPVSWTLLDSNRSVLASGSDMTTSYGWIQIPPGAIPAGYSGRLEVVASVQSPDGPITDTAYRSAREGSGIFGIALVALSGSVEITPVNAPDKRTIHSLVNGAFEAPEMASVAGPVTITLSEPSGRRISRTVTKDLGAYYVAIDDRPAPLVSTFSPSSGRIGSVVTIAGANFYDVIAVAFGAVYDASFTVESPSQIVVVVPPEAQSGRITIVTSAGAVTADSPFTVVSRSRAIRR
jgi:IPT/TIG domain.